jgi:hypothetical protein
VPYTIDRDLTAGGGALIDQVSHWDVNLFSGARLPATFKVPVEFSIDTDSEGRRMPTLFMVPAFVATRAFHEALLAAGVDNVEAYPAVITDPASGARTTDYVFLNVVGRVQCADLAGSETQEIGHGVTLIDRLAVKGDQLPEAHIFRLQEDELTVVISDHLHDRLLAAGFDDIHYEPVTVR